MEELDEGKKMERPPQGAVEEDHHEEEDEFLEDNAPGQTPLGWGHPPDQNPLGRGETSMTQTGPGELGAGNHQPAVGNFLPHSMASVDVLSVPPLSIRLFPVLFRKLSQ